MNSKSSIIFINQSSGYLMVDIVNYHVPLYDEVILLTGNLLERNTTLNENVKVKYLKKYNKNNNLLRIFTWSVFFFQSFFYLMFHKKKSKIYFVSNPPLNTFLAYFFLKRKFSFLVFDIYPQSLSKLPYFKENSYLYKKWEKVNKIVFTKAHNVFSISKGMNGVLKKYTTKEKLKYTSLWVDDIKVEKVNRKNNFSIKYNLVKSFNCVYSGNLGFTHPVESICYIANQIKNENIKFIIAGEGHKRNQILELKKEKNIENLYIFPFQNKNKFKELMAFIDIGFVTLDDESSNLSVPSKFFSLIANGIVIIGICKKDSELGNLIKNYGVGASFRKDEISQISNYITKLSSDKELFLKLKKNSTEASKKFNNSIE